MTPILLALSLVLSAHAAESPCKGDVEKFCKGILPGEGRIISCLKSHEAELSQECKDKGTELKAAVKDFTAACKEDISTVCKGIMPGGGRILSCLKSNEAKLSPGCQAAMTKKPKS